MWRQTSASVILPHIALFTHFITCGVWETVYILDGLLKNLSDIQPDTLYADTQGQSGPVFAISYLLGIKLMPRIRNWKDLTFLRPSESATYKYIDPLFKGVVNWNLIKTHWLDMMRVVLSIKAGKVMPSTLLRKLGSYSKKIVSIKRSKNWVKLCGRCFCWNISPPQKCELKLQR